MDQIKVRLAELEKEYQAGEQQLRGLLQQESAVRETMLRISGAIQVLQELIAAENGTGSAATDPSPQPAVLTVP